MVVVDATAVELRRAPSGAGSACVEILSSLPAWFSDPGANRAYAAAAERGPAILSEAHGAPIGLALLSRHSPTPPRSPSWRFARSGTATVSGGDSSSSPSRSSRRKASTTCR